MKQHYVLYRLNTNNLHNSNFKSNASIRRGVEDVQTCQRRRQPLTEPSPRRPVVPGRPAERRTPCFCLSHCTATITSVDTMLPLKDMSLLSVVLLVLFSVTICGAMFPARCSCHDDTLQATCADAQLEVVPIQLNPDLQQIDLRTNRTPFKKLKVSRMPRLSRIDPRAFVDNIRLETVMLDENMDITVLPTRIFHGNHHLLHVSIRSNSLTTLDASHFLIDRLRSLDVSGNPFICNCSLLWLWKLAQDEQKLSEVVPPSSVNETTRSVENNETLRINLQNLKCARPEALQGHLLVDVPESTVRCETTWLTVAVVTALVLGLFGATCVILLLIGTDKKLFTCKRSKDPGDSSGGAETRRLATSLHSNGAPPPILMLMPDKEYPMNDTLMHGYMKTRGDPQLRDLRYLEPWVPVKTIDRGLGHNDYSMDVSTMRKPPHIVYV